MSADERIQTVDDRAATQPHPTPRIAVIGSGRMGSALATALATHVGPVLWASRDPAELGARIARAGLRARACTPEAAVEAAEWVIPTLWLRDLLPWLERMRPRLRDRLVIDVSNPFTPSFDDFTTPADWSAAEEVQRVLGETPIVGAFKTTWWTSFAEADREPGRSDVLVTGDDDAMRAAVIAGLQPLPFRFVDAGALRNSRTVERMTLLAREIAMRGGHYPVVGWRVWGRDGATAGVATAPPSSPTTCSARGSAN